MYAEVIIEYNSKHIDKTFTYKIPSRLNIKPGMKVKVPFGKNTINGFVLNIKNDSNLANIREIIDIIDSELILNEELIKVGIYLKDKTLCSLTTAFQTMLPSSFKIDKNKDYSKYISYVILNNDEKFIKDYINNNQRYAKQIAILKRLMKDKKVKKEEINSSSLNTLLKKELVKIEKEEVYRINIKNDLKNDVKLTKEQENVYLNIKNDFNKEKVFLLHGVTGSGKTEIYFKLIKDVINLGKTAILLVPEISLTAQILDRCYKVFGSDVAVLHSGLSNSEKYNEYQKILRKEVNLVVGTRSAIFAPLTNLGIIIIDEEHSENYKQDSNPRYNAIDIAKFRAHLNNIPLLLASATPSLESAARAYKGVYKLLTLKNRIGSSVLPKVEIVDMQKEAKKRNLIFSEKLSNKIWEKLNKKEQIILLLNRRGYSTFVTCQNCGYTYKCPNCDITLTYHKTSNSLRCHYCEYNKKLDNICPKCHEDALSYLGLGTEKLEMEIKKKFPMARVVRMDVDTTRRKNATANIINDFANYKYDILLGTQMITKGFDFPLVTLVGIINADTSLNIPDFRSGERTFSQLLQASGRAGRKDKMGEVIIQTYNKDNYAILNVLKNDYINFFKEEMKIRKTLKYPPYVYLTLIKIKSTDYNLALNNAIKTSKFLKSNLSNVIILGPSPASLFRTNNQYRFQILLKYKDEEIIKNTLKKLDEIFLNIKNVSIEIDIDPLYT